jgi:hypothetical protein
MEILGEHRIHRIKNRPSKGFNSACISKRTQGYKNKWIREVTPIKIHILSSFYIGLGQMKICYTLQQ